MISVVMAATRTEFLRAAIESYAAQDYPDKELVIVDDGSSAKIKEEVEKFHRDDIRYYYQPHAGAAAAYNKAVMFATGDLLCKLDDDDRLHPENSLSARAEVMESRKFVSVYGGYNEMTAAGKVIKTFMPKQVDRKKMLERDTMCTGSFMWRRGIEAHGVRFPEDVEYSEDYEFKLRLLHEGECATLNKIVYQVRWHGSNKSMRDRDEMDKCNARIKKRMREKYEKKN